MGETETDLVQVVRLALAGQSEDVRLFVARLVRKYRKTNPELADQLNFHLCGSGDRKNHILREIK